MTGFDLPEECPECGSSCGWYVPEDQRVFIKRDGTVKIGGDNTRWGQKIEASCNSFECDAVVSIYIEAEAVNNGSVESTGALELLNRLDDHKLIPDQVEQECDECGQNFVTELDAELASDGGIDLRANLQCPDHPYSGFLIDTVEHLTPADIRDKAELLPEKQEVEAE